MVQKIVKECQIWARFCEVYLQKFWGQPLYSLERGHTMYMDVIGPMTVGKSNVNALSIVQQDI